MTREELKLKIHEHETDERQGYAEYLKWSESAEILGLYSIAKVLKDMAEEEKIHSEMLAKMEKEM